jgi:ParB family transcriptional regulator, chromosome partitioning protein
MMTREMIEIDLHLIRKNPFQPRKHFNREELEDLALSIRSVGLLHPPVVRRVEGNGELFELVAGERRYHAAQLAGMKFIPVIVVKESGDYSAEAALIENIQRVDLNPLEIAKALRRLMEEFGLQQEELALKVGKKRSTLANYLRLLTLPHKIQESVQSGLISMGHAKAILSVDGFERQLYLHDLVVEEGLSVRETEEAAKNREKILKRILPKQPADDCYLIDLQERLQVRLGTKVIISSQGNQGKIMIDYYSLDDLDRVLEVIG